MQIFANKKRIGRKEKRNVPIFTILIASLLVVSLIFASVSLAMSRMAFAVPGSAALSAATAAENAARSSSDSGSDGGSSSNKDPKYSSGDAQAANTAAKVNQDTTKMAQAANAARIAAQHSGSSSDVVPNAPLGIPLTGTTKAPQTGTQTKSPGTPGLLGGGCGTRTIQVDGKSIKDRYCADASAAHTGSNDQTSGTSVGSAPQATTEIPKNTIPIAPLPPSLPQLSAAKSAVQAAHAAQLTIENSGSDKTTKASTGSTPQVGKETGSSTSLTPSPSQLSASNAAAKVNQDTANKMAQAANAAAKQGTSPLGATSTTMTSTPAGHDSNNLGGDDSVQGAIKRANEACASGDVDACVEATNVMLTIIGSSGFGQTQGQSADAPQGAYTCPDGSIGPPCVPSSPDNTCANAAAQQCLPSPNNPTPKQTGDQSPPKVQYKSDKGQSPTGSQGTSSGSENGGEGGSGHQPTPTVQDQPYNGPNPKGGQSPQEVSCVWGEPCSSIGGIPVNPHAYEGPSMSPQTTPPDEIITWAEWQKASLENLERHVMATADPISAICSQGDPDKALGCSAVSGVSNSLGGIDVPGIPGSGIHIDSKKNSGLGVLPGGYVPKKYR